MLVFFVAIFLLAFAAGFTVAWILQSALKAAAYLTALFALAVVAAFVVWRHPLMADVVEGAGLVALGGWAGVSSRGHDVYGLVSEL